MTPLIAASAVLCVAYITRSSKALVFFSVPFLIIGYFTLSTRVFEFGKIVPFGLYNDQSETSYAFVQLYLLGHFLAAFVGISAAALLSRSPRALGRPEGSTWVTLLATPASTRERPLGIFPFLVCLSPAGLVVAAVGLDELVSRGHFVPDFANGSVMRFADISFWFSTLVTPFLRRSWMRAAVLIAVVVAFSALGSRSAPVMLIIYVLVDSFIFTGRWAVRHSVLSGASVALLALLLAVRATGDGGLAALAETAVRLTFWDLLTFGSFGLNYMLNYSVVINAEMIAADAAEMESFLYSVLPVPSGVYGRTEWYDAANRFRVNVPYPGFGYAISYLGSAVYMGAVAVTFFSVELVRSWVITRRDLLDRILYYGWVFLPFLVSLQYNLRTASRLFYLFLAIYFVFGVGRRFRIRPIAKHTD